MKYSIIAIIALALFSESCILPIGRLSKRHKEMYFRPVDTLISNYISVSAYVISPEAPAVPSPKTVFDLSPEGQKEFIKSISLKDATSEKFINQLGVDIPGSKAIKPEQINYTKFNKRIIISLRNLSRKPCDRIGKINIKIEFDTALKIESCNRLETQYQTFDAAKLNQTTTVSGELTANATSGANTANALKFTNSGQATGDRSDLPTESNSSNTLTSQLGAAGKLSASRSFSEEVMLRQRIVALNAFIDGNTLSIYADGISGIDLTGNIIIDVTLQAKKELIVDRTYSFSRLVEKDTFTAPQKIEVNSFRVTHLNKGDDVKSDLTYYGEFREVKKGCSTITEADDKVELLYGECTAERKFDILKLDDFKPKFWILACKQDISYLPVEIQSFQIKGPLKFHSYEEALAFLLWLRVKFNGSPAVGGKTMEINQSKYKLIMPASFTGIGDLDIFPYE